MNQERLQNFMILSIKNFLVKDLDKNSWFYNIIDLENGK